MRGFSYGPADELFRRPVLGRFLPAQPGRLARQFVGRRSDRARVAAPYITDVISIPSRKREEHETRGDSRAGDADSHALPFRSDLRAPDDRCVMDGAAYRSADPGGAGFPVIENERPQPLLPVLPSSTRPIRAGADRRTPEPMNP